MFEGFYLVNVHVQLQFITHFNAIVNIYVKQSICFKWLFVVMSA